MRIKLIVPALSLLLALGTTACKKDPETEPLYLIRDELEWDQNDRLAVVAQYFYNDLYRYLSDGFNRVGALSGAGDYLASGTDDALPSRLAQPIEYYTNGSVSAVNNPDAYWATAYAGIRRVNIFLANIDKVPGSATAIVYWKAEARFIRSILYFELLRRYGGVPLISDRLFTLEDNLELPRNTYEETVNYIVSECDAIKGQLRTPAQIPDGDWGRVPNTAALALKSRVLLYAASPLFNGGQVNGAGELQGYTSYSAARWQTALDAAQELISTNSHSLLTTATAPNTAFGSVFIVKKNAEIILGRQVTNNTVLEATAAPVGYTNPAASQGLTSPSQNFVDAFPTLTGLDINAPGSGYSAQNPYANRDPRLAASIFYNGRQWLSRTVQTFDGGLDRPGGAAVQTRTGYYLRKFLNEYASGTTYSNVSHNYAVFRYAETLLNAAEALNELGRTEEAIVYIIAIRRRAGLTAGTTNRYGIPVGISQSAARTLIRNERRIELGFEEHRFWDIRRWKIADNVLAGPLNGVRIVRGGTSPSFTFTYSYAPVRQLVFNQRLYYMPLPYDEIIKNRNLVQNPGW